MSLKKKQGIVLVGLGKKYVYFPPPKFLASTRTYLTNRLKLQGMRFQYAQKHAYSHRPFGPNFHEVRI